MFDSQLALLIPLLVGGFILPVALGWLIGRSGIVGNSERTLRISGQVLLAATIVIMFTAAADSIFASTGGLPKLVEFASIVILAGYFAIAGFARGLSDRLR
jgi:hypothetical protein